MSGDRFSWSGNYQDMVRRCASLMLPLLLVGACDQQEDPAPKAGSTAPATKHPDGPTSCAPNLSTWEDTSSQSSPEDTDPAAKIVPGKGDCPSPEALLAAPEQSMRKLFVGPIPYRIVDPQALQHRVINDQAAYELLAQELKTSLPAVDFDQEQVLFGSILESSSCGMNPDPLRVVSVNNTTHADFSAYHSRGGPQCNMACGMIEEMGFIVAVAKTPGKVPTICTRNRVVCTGQ